MLDRQVIDDFVSSAFAAGHSREEIVHLVEQTATRLFEDLGHAKRYQELHEKHEASVAELRRLEKERDDLLAASRLSPQDEEA